MTKERKGEKINGGFLVFRRGKKTGRIGVRATTLPFEHPSQDAAQRECLRLSTLCPGERFAVFQQVFLSDAVEAE